MEADLMDGFELAVEEARRGADQQATVLAQQRSNTMALLAAAVAVATFLTGLAVQDNPGWTPLFVIAAVLTATHVLLALSIIWPHHMWTTVNPYELVAWTEVDHLDPPTQRRELALHLAAVYEDNAKTLNVMTTRYCFAVLTLVAVMTALTAELVN